MTTSLEALRINDVAIAMAVRRLGGVARASRELSIARSQVSKAVSRLERQIGVTLFVRGSKGMALSPSAQRVVPLLEAMLANWRSLRPEPEARPVLTLAAPSYLNAYFGVAIVKALPGVRFRLLQLPAAQVRARASENLFDVALSAGEVQLPASWDVTLLGTLRKGLFANPGLARALGAGPYKPRQIASLRFVTPIGGPEDHLTPVEDGCPLSVWKRRGGHQVPTFGLALALARRVPEVAFGPAVAARPWLASGALVELRVRGWAATDPLFLACNQDRVLASTREAVVQQVRASLALANQ